MYEKATNRTYCAKRPEGKWNPHLPLTAAHKWGGNRAVIGVIWARIVRRSAILARFALHHTAHNGPWPL